MPAVDPFSALFRPFTPREKVPAERTTTTHNGRDSATVLQPVDQNTISTPNTTVVDTLNLPKPRKYKDELPVTFYEPAYRHTRTTSTAALDSEQQALQTNSSAAEVGSDAWMDQQVTRCLDISKGDLDIKGKGLTSLSTGIAELKNLVTLSTTSTSPLPPSPYTTRSPLGRQSPSYTHSPNETLSPGAGPYSANSRPFIRHVSAPVSAHAYYESRQARAMMDRQPSGLRTGGTLLDSPTLTETSEDGSEATPPPPNRGLLASPSLDAPRAGATFGGGRRELGRSKTGFPSRVFNTILTEKEVTINAAQNSLTSLPSALFEIHSLTSLTLRSNRLTRLPAAIGELQNLKELNIGNNKISELPSSITLLKKLDNFLAHPNPWLKPPEIESINGRLLGPLITHSSENVSRLYELCVNVMMTPRLPSNLPPMIDPGYDWEQRHGKAHPLLDPSELQLAVPNLDERDCAKVLQALRSACIAASRQSSSLNARRDSTSSNTGHSNRESLFPSTSQPLRPDDAAENPYYNPCPNPAHHESTTSELPVMSRRLYLRAAEERLEWTTICAQKDLPIRWKGCSPGCLEYLEHGHIDEDEDELWGLSDEDE